MEQKPALEIPEERPSLLQQLTEQGPRNMAIGVSALIVASAVLAAALFMSGAVAIVPVLAAVAAFAAAWLLWQLKLHEQKNGFFLSLCVTCVVGAMVALLAGIATFVSQQGPITAATPAAPVQETPPEQPSSKLPLLTAEFGLEAPNPETTAYVRVQRASKIMLDGKPYLIARGDTFPLHHEREGQVAFKVRDFAVSLPSQFVEVVKPAGTSTGTSSVGAAPAAAQSAPAPRAADPAKVRAAQQEAARRYPALTIADTRENKVYVAEYQRLRDQQPEFFEQDDWPLLLADALAEREGWERLQEPSAE